LVLLLALASISGLGGAEGLNNIFKDILVLGGKPGLVR
jgi:hypothetical protein